MTSGCRAFVIAALLGMAAGLWTWTAPADAALAPTPGGPVVEAHLLDNGFHTDLAVPRAELEARPGPLAEAVRALPEGDWILIGWGDAKFYVDQSPMQGRLPDGLRAFFRPGNASVVMLDPSRRDPRLSYPPDARTRLRLSPAGFDALSRHVEVSLALTDGRARIAAARAGDDARFFASREHFWIGHLCNHWTAGVLNAGGVAVRPLRSVTSAEVMAAARRSALAAPELDRRRARD